MIGFIQMVCEPLACSFHCFGKSRYLLRDIIVSGCKVPLKRAPDILRADRIWDPTVMDDTGCEFGPAFSKLADQSTSHAEADRTDSAHFGPPIHEIGYSPCHIDVGVCWTMLDPVARL